MVSQKCLKLKGWLFGSGLLSFYYTNMP